MFIVPRFPSVIRSVLRSVLLGMSVAAMLGAHAQSTVPPDPAGDFVQVPGVYRQVMGDLQVTALFDGVAFLPASQMQDIDLKRAHAWLNQEYVPQTPKGVQTAVNAYLVRLNGDLILVDAGTADCFGPALGQVLANLRHAGAQPQDVKHVLLTHAHPDHLCGILASDGKPAYPNATVWLSQGDAAYWLSTTVRDKAPQAMRPLFDMARKAVAPYQGVGRFKTFQSGESPLRGVAAIPSPGHTPGHTSWLIQGGTAQAPLLVWGDIVHYHAVQFRRPETSFEFDSNRPEAIASRKRLLAQAAEKGWWVAGAHLPFPGIGRVRKGGEGYRWVAAEFGPTAKP